MEKTFMFTQPVLCRGNNAKNAVLWLLDFEGRVLPDGPFDFVQVLQYPGGMDCLQ
ncbi:hypothetical protein ASPTUDRAFT_50259 [Aspergillus tubingensis CBS 134.48]|uniref:Uncharacterized protein n=1 Tax=Aspergillus tubingensis (strain CBS 134.48) TaxID=767770 RepID=A0A1L9NJ10_ASPTC|nr:hypothetical protein ASPTUDRAFT_50259 [Aspergillus tubingensis CBS 134.48]